MAPSSSSLRVPILLVLALSVPLLASALLVRPDSRSDAVVSSHDHFPASRVGRQLRGRDDDDVDIKPDASQATNTTVGKIINALTRGSLWPRRFGYASAATALSGGFIYYHSGPIMPTVNVYIVYYGAWSNSAKGLVEQFLTDLNGPAGGSGGSTTAGGWWAISTKYFQRKGLFGAKTYVGAKVTVKGTAVDNLSLGTNIQDSDIQSIVDNAISSAALPFDSNGVYFVLSDPTVNVIGFCTSFCGYHDYMAITGGRNVKYAFVGDTSKCPKSCAMQTSSPNGNAGIDGSLSVIAHELSEVATDPQPGSGWLNFRGYENADLCAWKFGAYKTLGTYNYNMVGKSGAKYFIQLNWDRVTQKCVLSG